jgi:ectoine hydroxylase-related dioxygenase (phytanoyl-CoA dioxygenase family)
MYSNVHDLPVEINRTVGAMINEALGPLVQSLCADYTLKGGTYLVKGCGPDSVCKVHQDWNTVDESQFVGLVVWVPLVDVDRSNGCLVVSPGTHRRELFPTYRGASFESPHLDLDADIQPHLIDLPLLAGEICFFAQNLFHGSWPNLSGDVRASLYAGAIPREAHMLHYHQADADSLVVLPIDEEFYYSGAAAALASGESPELTPTEIIPSASNVEVSKEAFLSTVRSLERADAR